MSSKGVWLVVLGLVGLVLVGSALQSQQSPAGTLTAAAAQPTKTCRTLFNDSMSSQMHEWTQLAETTQWDHAQGAKLQPLRDRIVASAYWPACASDTRAKAMVFMDTTIAALLTNSTPAMEKASAAGLAYSAALQQLDHLSAY